VLTPNETWPWEFDFYEWSVGGRGPLDTPPFGGSPPPSDFASRAPEFSPHEPPRGLPEPDAAAARIADDLAQALSLPATTVLYLVVLA
jgi:hypothetical protein